MGSIGESIKISNRTHSFVQPPTEVATSPNDLNRVPAVIKSIQTLGDGFSALDNNTRIKLLAEARHLVRSLETPRETMIKHNWAQVSLPMQMCVSRADRSSPLHIWPSHWVLISVSSEPC